MKTCDFLAVAAIFSVACVSAGGAPVRNSANDEGLSMPDWSTESEAPSPGDPSYPCQDDDSRVECRRSLHHYDEFERSSQGEIYQTDPDSNSPEPP